MDIIIFLVIFHTSFKLWQVDFWLVSGETGANYVKTLLFKTDYAKASSAKVDYAKASSTKILFLRIAFPDPVLKYFSSSLALFSVFTAT